MRALILPNYFAILNVNQESSAREININKETLLATSTDQIEIASINAAHTALTHSKIRPAYIALYDKLVMKLGMDALLRIPLPFYTSSSAENGAKLKRNLINPEVAKLKTDPHEAKSYQDILLAFYNYIIAIKDFNSCHLYVAVELDTAFKIVANYLKPYIQTNNLFSASASASTNHSTLYPIKTEKGLKSESFDEYQEFDLQYGHSFSS